MREEKKVTYSLRQEFLSDPDIARFVQSPGRFDFVVFISVAKFENVWGLDIGDVG